MRSHDDAVRDQFDPQAHAYLTSVVHASGLDLQRASELVQAVMPPTATLLDVGCGAGHLSFALAPAFAEVVATDPLPAMLATVSAAASERGLTQIRTQQAAADALPFAVGRFCLVASRYSAHHWRELPGALRELRRVVKPHGYLLLIDQLGDESPLVDTHLQTMELLRDPSHVRNRSASQWRELLAQAGFRLLEETSWPLRLDFASWIARMRTPPESVAAIRRLQTGAPREVADGLKLEADGSFTTQTGLFWAQTAATGTD